MFEFAYCECECGERIEVMAGDKVDEKATKLAAYQHFVTCEVAFESAPQLIVEMAETITDHGWELPKAATKAKTKSIIDGAGKDAKNG